jgi:hypothetical protein
LGGLVRAAAAENHGEHDDEQNHSDGRRNDELATPP